MIAWIVGTICLLSWCLQIWFGVAVCGLPGNHELVFREKSPVKFWIIILLEIAVVPLIAWYKLEAGFGAGVAP